MEMPLIFALAGFVFVAGLLGLFVYIGQRSGRSDLIAPPKSFGKREYGRRPVAAPAPRPSAPKKPEPRTEPPPPAPELTFETPEIAVPQIEKPALETVTVAAPDKAEIGYSATEMSDAAAFWRREGPTGHARLSEDGYTAEQYAEREVKALLLQNRRDRAVRHARSALDLSAEAAEAYVDEVERGTPILQAR